MLEKEKLIQAAHIVQALGVDLWITFGRETSMNNDPVLPLLSTIDFASLTALMISKDGNITLLTGHMDGEGAILTGIFEPENVVTYDKSFQDAFYPMIKSLAPKKIALNYSLNDVAADGLSHGNYLKLCNMLTEAGFTGEIISSEKIIGKLRGIKSPTEVAYMEEGIRITDKIFEDAKNYIKEGVSEKEIHRYFHDRMEHYGVTSSWHPEQCPGVMLGPDTIFGHSGPTDLKAKKGDVITLDFGVKYNEYCTDVQRVYYLLEDGETQVPEEVQKTFLDIQEAVRKGLAVMKPGVKGFEVDGAARDYIESLGYEEFNFGFGHQVGRRAHDGGFLLAPPWDRYKGSIEQELEEGMIFTVDVNLPTSRGHVGQEDMAMVTKDGGVLMTSRQKEIYAIK